MAKCNQLTPLPSKGLNKQEYDIQLVELKSQCEIFATA